MSKCGEFHMVTSLPLCSRGVTPDLLADVFRTYCNGLSYSDWEFSEQFLDLPKEVQDKVLKDLREFIRDNLLYNNLFGKQVKAGRMVCDETAKASKIEIEYARFN